MKLGITTLTSLSLGDVDYVEIANPFPSLFSTHFVTKIKLGITPLTSLSLDDVVYLDIVNPF